MSIDVNNESGTDIDEQAILDVARYAVARMRIHPLSELSVIVVDADAWSSSTSSGWTSPARPMSCPSRWTSCVRRPRTTRSPRRAPR